MTRFRAQISLDHIHCYKQREISGGEPYLWTALFKIDGDTIVVDLDAGEVFLDGPCTFVATTSSHGNLEDTDVHEGNDVPIPPAVGELEFTVSTFGKAGRLGGGDTNVRGRSALSWR